MTTFLGRTFVTRAPPRGLDPRSLFHPVTHGFWAPGMPVVHPRAQPLRPPAAVGLFETSSDVNTCILQVHRLVECLDAHLMATLQARYPKATFLSAKMLPDCTIGGETVAKLVPDGTSGTVNVCDMGPTFDRDNLAYNQWKIFRRSFLDFERDWDDEILSIMSADSYRKCQDFAKRTNEWLVRMGALGVGVATCPVIPSSTTDDALETLLSIAKWGVAGLFLVGLLLVVRG